jgi:caffeoyl-CoA O-methyltransferase
MKSMQWKRVSVLAFVAVLAFAFAWGLVYAQRGGVNALPPLAKTESEKKILSVLDQMRENKVTYLSVPPADGRVLRLLTESINAQHVVEIGTSTGYSGLWFALALAKTGGKLTTHEFDAGRAAMARKHFQQAGVDQFITVVEGNAHETIQKVKGPLDLVFIDADKEGYSDYLEKVLPLVRPGGLILAHNVGMRQVAEDYVKRVTANPDLETVFFMDGAGLSVTLKKR